MQIGYDNAEVGELEDDVAKRGVSSADFGAEKQHYAGKKGRNKRVIGSTKTIPNAKTKQIQLSQAEVAGKEKVIYKDRNYGERCSSCVNSTLTGLKRCMMFLEKHDFIFLLLLGTLQVGFGVGLKKRLLVDPPLRKAAFFNSIIPFSVIFLILAILVYMVLLYVRYMSKSPTGLMKLQAMAANPFIIAGFAAISILGLVFYVLVIVFSITGEYDVFKKKAKIKFFMISIAFTSSLILGVTVLSVYKIKKTLANYQDKIANIAKNIDVKSVQGLL